MANSTNMTTAVDTGTISPQALGIAVLMLIENPELLALLTETEVTSEECCGGCCAGDTAGSSDVVGCDPRQVSMFND